MERGIVLFNNAELTFLHNLAVVQGCKKHELIDRLKPVCGADGKIDLNQECTIQISEDEAEIMLDCMPIPNEKADPNLTSSRFKIQQFISKCRFGDQA